MSRWPALLLLTVSLTGLAPAWADVLEIQQAEVQHLLAFIRESGCQMERNGKLHSPEKAQSHLTRKYNFYRNSITQTEDFIKKAASYSVLSGRSYLTRCFGREPQPTAEWLKQELERFRGEQAAQ
jgi:hypothetical protein